MLPVCGSQVLEGFGGRCGDVQLDGLATSRAEMDKVGGCGGDPRGGGGGIKQINETECLSCLAHVGIIRRSRSLIIERSASSLVAVAVISVRIKGVGSNDHRARDEAVEGDKDNALGDKETLQGGSILNKEVVNLAVSAISSLSIETRDACHDDADEDGEASAVHAAKGAKEKLHLSDADEAKD